MTCPVSKSCECDLDDLTDVIFDELGSAAWEHCSINRDVMASSVKTWLVEHLPTVLRAAGDPAVAEALREIGWTVRAKVREGHWEADGFVEHHEQCIEAESEWRPVTSEGDET